MSIEIGELRQKGKEALLGAPMLFVSVDLESDGIAGKGSMLSLAAKAISDEEFYEPEIKPHFDHFLPENRQFNNEHGLEYERLMAEGRPAEDAMADFYAWAQMLRERHQKELVLNGVNAGYDHAILDLYLKTFGYDNPFGPSAFDTKSLALIFSTNWDWEQTKKRLMPAVLVPSEEFTHNALDDVRYQTNLLLGMVGVLSDLRVRAGVQAALSEVIADSAE